MKIYLASFLEPNNFGPGRIIGIVNDNKPSHIKCDVRFEPLTPKKDILDNYKNMSVNDYKNAGKKFVSDFTKQLDDFYNEVIRLSKEENKDVKEILPFQDGDTLVSWERANYTNYRGLVANFLKKLGYKVVVN